MKISPNSENSSWEVVYKGLCINEEVNLLQILKFSEQRVLALLRFCGINKTLMLSIENYICRAVIKTTGFDFDYMVPGSKPEALLFYSNSSKKFWKGILTETKLRINDELQVFDKHDQRLISAAFIRHQNRVIYIYESGGVDDYSLRGSEQLDYSAVYPQRYNKVFVSDCERFIFLISNNSFCIFSSNMSIITFLKLVPTYLLLVQDNLKMLVRNNDEFEFKTFTFRDNHLGEAPNTEMTLDKVRFYTRMTLDFGKNLMKEMISSNKFEANGSK